MLDLAVGLLLVVAVGVQIACCVCLLLFENVLDRLHLLGAAALVSGGGVTLAVWLQHGFASASIKATLVLVVLLATGPILAHTMAAAITRREEPG